jgi:outer membrane protein OmpA-like peptidoglycan-associated protein
LYSNLNLFLTDTVFFTARTILAFFKNYGVIFSVSQEEAAYVVAAISDNYGKDSTQLKKWSANSKRLSLAKSQDGGVLTYGKFDEIGANVDTLNKVVSSKYEDVVKYLNNTMLQDLMDNQSEGNISNAGIDLSLVSYTGKSSNNNALMIPQAAAKTPNGIVCYGTAITTPDKVEYKPKPEIFEIPEKGQEIIKNLDSNLFATGKIELASTADIDSTIEEVNKILKDNNMSITAIVIESSASGDRPVGGKSGYPNDKADLSKYPIGTPYIPKSSTESGNAGLAFGRGETIKKYLTSKGFNQTITVSPMIQTGGDQAQYAKIKFILYKIDKPREVITSTELEKIVTAGTRTELGDTLQITMYRRV